MRFDVLLMRTEDGRFSAIVPAMRDWFTFGDTESEVLDRARGAIGDFISTKDGLTAEIILICRRLSLT